MEHVDEVWYYEAVPLRIVVLVAVALVGLLVILVTIIATRKQRRPNGD